MCPCAQTDSATQTEFEKEEGHGIRLDYSEKRRPHLRCSFLSFFCRSSGLLGGILFKVPLVLLDYLPGGLLHPHVFCDRRISPLFLASFVQNEPRVPIRNGLSRHHVYAEGRALVGRQSSASPSLFGHGRGPALPYIARLSLGPCGLDLIGSLQPNEDRSGRRFQ